MRAPGSSMGKVKRERAAAAPQSRHPVRLAAMAMIVAVVAFLAAAALRKMKRDADPLQEAQVAWSAACVGWSLAPCLYLTFSNKRSLAASFYAVRIQKRRRDLGATPAHMNPEP